MDTQGFEPWTSRMLSGCDTATPCAHTHFPIPPHQPIEMYIQRSPLWVYGSGSRVVLDLFTKFRLQRPTEQTQEVGVDNSAEHILEILPNWDVGRMDIHRFRI